MDQSKVNLKSRKILKGVIRIKMPTRTNMCNVLSALIDFGQPVSTMQVAKRMMISWKTARDNLEAVFKLGLVEKGTVGKNKRIFWKGSDEIVDRVDFGSKEYKEKEKSLKIKER